MNDGCSWWDGVDLTCRSVVYPLLACSLDTAVHTCYCCTARHCSCALNREAVFVQRYHT